MPTTKDNKKAPNQRAATSRPEQIEPIDLHIGSRLRGARNMRGLSRGDLAARVGLGPQAIEKYERGEARVLASRLFALAQTLNVPVGFFYEQFSDQPPPSNYDAILAATTPDAMQMLLGLEMLTREQRNMVRGMIDTMLRQNQQAAAGAAA